MKTHRQQMLGSVFDETVQLLGRIENMLKGNKDWRWFQKSQVCCINIQEEMGDVPSATQESGHPDSSG